MSSLPDTVMTSPTVIVSGPPMTGKYRLFHRLLAHRGNRPVVITTKKTAEEFRADHQTILGSEQQLLIVDCITAGQNGDPTDTSETAYVDSPGNLTQIGVKVTNFLERSPEDTTGTVVGLHSLSQILLHAGLDQTYQFIHILAQQTAAGGWPLLAVLNKGAHDDQTKNAIFERFDCLIETRATNGIPEYRVRTAMTDPGDWERI